MKCVRACLGVEHSTSWHPKRESCQQAYRDKGLKNVLYIPGTRQSYIITMNGLADLVDGLDNPLVVKDQDQKRSKLYTQRHTVLQ